MLHSSSAPVQDARRRLFSRGRTSDYVSLYKKRSRLLRGLHHSLPALLLQLAESHKNYYRYPLSTFYSSPWSSTTPLELDEQQAQYASTMSLYCKTKRVSIMQTNSAIGRFHYSTTRCCLATPLPCPAPFSMYSRRAACRKNALLIPEHLAGSTTRLAMISLPSVAVKPSKIFFCTPLIPILLKFFRL